MIFNDNTVDTAAQAMQALLSQQLSTVGYDKTLVYTITDDSTKDKGSYTVSDGSVSFIAYTEDTTYKKDDKVYVTIPQGDFTQKKIIIGRYIDSLDEEQGVGYISPEDRIVPIYNFTAPYEPETAPGMVVSNSQSFGNKQYYYLSKGGITVQDLQNINKTQNYIETELTRLFIKVGFKNSLSNYNVISGEYGIGFILVSSKNVMFKIPEIDWNNKEVEDLLKEFQENPNYEISRIEFSSKDMMGNIYNYLGTNYQSNIYDISALGNIFGGIIYLYQCNDFKAQGLTGVNDLYKLLPKDSEGNIISEDNIKLEFFEIAFGYGQEEFEAESNLLLNLDRTQDNFYKSGASEKKKAYLRLIELNSDNKKFEYVPLGEGVEVFESSFEVEDNKAGLGWKTYQKNGTANLELNINSKDPTKSFKVLKIFKNENQEEVKVIESNLLTFQNADFAQNVSGIISLSCDEGTLFDFYGEDFKIEDQIQSRTVKTIRAILPQARQFTKAKVVWTIPTQGTMLQHPNKISFYQTYQNENTHYLDNSNAGQYIITSFYDKGQEVKLGFGIRDMYVPSFLNNQINCRVYYDDDESYYDEGDIIFNFGNYVSGGTDYKFGMYFEDPDVTCLYSVGGATLILSPLVINKDRTEDEINQIINSLEISLDDGQTWVNTVTHKGLNYCIENGKIKISFSSNSQRVSEILNCRINTNAWVTGVESLYIIYKVPIAIGLKIFESDDTGFQTQTRVAGIQAPIHLKYSSLGEPLGAYNSLELKLYTEKEKIKNNNGVVAIAEEPVNQTVPAGKVGQWWENQVVGQNLLVDNFYTTIYDEETRFNCDPRIFTITLKTSLENISFPCTAYIRSTTIISSNNGWHKVLILTQEGGNQYNILYLNTSSTGTNDANIFMSEKFKKDLGEEKVFLYSKSGDETNNKLSNITKISSTSNPPLVLRARNTYNDDNTLIQDGSLEGLKVEKYSFQGQNIKIEKLNCTIKYTDEEVQSIYGANLTLKEKVESEKRYYEYNFYWFKNQNGETVYNINPHLNTEIKTILLDKMITKTDTIEFYYISSIPRTIDKGENVLSGVSSYTLEKLKTMDSAYSSNPLPRIVLIDSDKVQHWFKCNYNVEAKTITFESDAKYENATLCVEDLDYVFAESSGGAVSEGDIQWRIVEYSNAFVRSSASGIGIPSILQKGNSFYLQHYPFYQDIGKTIYLEAYKNQSDGGEVIYWHQPILTTQDTYGYGVLNEWKGTGTEITEGSIMSPCIGAGSKNTNNQFSGVLMGKIGTNSNDTNPVHGLYGFSDGAQAFGFKEDGTAFIGKSGAGRIYFDGKKGTITSFGYENGMTLEQVQEFDSNATEGWAKTGIKIDLDDPSLDMKYKGKSILEFVPKSNKMSLSSPEDGMSIDLINGEITSKNFELLSESGANGLKRKLQLSTKDNENGLFMGYESESAYIFDLPQIKSGYNGIMSANSIEVGDLKIKDSTIKFSGSTGFTGDFISQNYMRYEANLVTIKITNNSDSDVEEYYDIYLNTIVPLYHSTDTDKTYVKCTHFLDLRPNFEKGVNNLTYISQLNSYYLNLTSTIENINDKDVTKYKVGLIKQTEEDKNKDYLYFKVLEIDEKEFQLNSLDSDRSIAGKLEGLKELRKFYPFYTGYTGLIVSYNAGTKYLIDIIDNQIRLDVYQMKPDWIITRNDRSPETTNVNEVLTQTISTIFGITDHNLEYSLGGDINSTEIFKVKVNSTVTKEGGILGGLIGRDKSITQGMWIDLAGNTYITDLYLRQYGVGSDKDFVGSKLSDYIIDSLRGYLLDKCTERDNKVYWDLSSWYVVGDKENITLEELISLAANASGARYD